MRTIHFIDRKTNIKDKIKVKNKEYEEVKQLIQEFGADIIK